MASKTTGIIVYIVLIVLVLIAWYISTHFALPQFKSPVTTPSSNAPTNNTINKTPPSNTTTNVLSIYSCNNLMIFFANKQSNSGATELQPCNWSGGNLGLWVASSNFSYERVILKNKTGKVYINETTTYTCPTLYNNYTLPAGQYLIMFKVGALTSSPAPSSCRIALMKFNTTTAQTQQQIYPFVYNGNFSTGTYIGWQLTGKGFGSKPLNLTEANNNTIRCYIGSPWRGYNGTYVATTFNCGISNAPGNLTSSLFYANKPFLNFKIISPEDNLLYVEILYSNDTPAIIAHYNTYNMNNTINASSTFMNATIPLLTVQGKPIRIRVVADTLSRERFIAVGDFELSNQPKETPGILVGSYNITGVS
ncbi:MAG: hypothetical protein ACP5RI_03240 [Candidatus Micrarchaeia archaeon]